MKDKIIVPPGRGGCWYCHTISDYMMQSSEWDCNVHIACIKKRAMELIEYEDAELYVFIREFNILE